MRKVKLITESNWDSQKKSTKRTGSENGEERRVWEAKSIPEREEIGTRDGVVGWWEVMSHGNSVFLSDYLLTMSWFRYNPDLDVYPTSVNICALSKLRCHFWLFCEYANGKEKWKRRVEILRSVLFRNSTCSFFYTILLNFFSRTPQLMTRKQSQLRLRFVDQKITRILAIIIKTTVFSFSRTSEKQSIGFHSSLPTRHTNTSVISSLPFKRRV